MKFNIREIPELSKDYFIVEHSSMMNGITLPYRIRDGFLEVLYMDGWEPIGITSDSAICGNKGSVLMFEHTDGRRIWCHTYRELSDFIDDEKRTLSDEDLKFLEVFNSELNR